MKLTQGGQTERMGAATIEEIQISGRTETIELWINESSLSYLTIDEAISLRDELNKSIAIRTGIRNMQDYPS